MDIRATVIDHSDNGTSAIADLDIGAERHVEHGYAHRRLGNNGTRRGRATHKAIADAVIRSDAGFPAARGRSARRRTAGTGGLLSRRTRASASSTSGIAALAATVRVRDATLLLHLSGRSGRLLGGLASCLSLSSILALSASCHLGLSGLS